MRPILFNLSTALDMPSHQCRPIMDVMGNTHGYLCDGPIGVGKRAVVAVIENIEYTWVLKATPTRSITPAKRDAIVQAFIRSTPEAQVVCHGVVSVKPGIGHHVKQVYIGETLYLTIGLSNASTAYIHLPSDSDNPNRFLRINLNMVGSHTNDALFDTLYRLHRPLPTVNGIPDDVSHERDPLTIPYLHKADYTDHRIDRTRYIG